jgi:capsular exopolysaccharide synthesis family protein
MDNSMSSGIRKSQGVPQVKDYLAIVVRRRWVILLSLLSVVGATVFFEMRVPDTYESFSILVIEQPTAVMSQAANAVTSVGRSIDFYQGILNSRTFLEMALDSIAADSFSAGILGMDRDAAAAAIGRSLSLRNTEYASLMRFNARAPSRELAYRIANVGTAVFRKRCYEVETEESRNAGERIDDQLKIVRSKLEEAEHDYQTYREKRGNITEGSTPELKTLQEAYGTSLAQLGLKEADLSAERKQLARLEASLSPAESGRSPEFLKLRSRLRELEQEKMRLENLGVRLPGSSTVDREIEETERQLLEYKKESGAGAVVDARTLKQWQDLRKSVLAKEEDLELFKRRLESYKKAIANYKENNPDILAQSLELLRLQRSREVYQNVYNALLEKSEEEHMRSASITAGIKVVDAARMPATPMPKNRMRFYLAGVLLGFALGLALAFLIEFSDTTIKTNDDVEKYLGLPILGTIPHITANKKDAIEIRRHSAGPNSKVTSLTYPEHLLSFSGDDSLIAESFRSLRTNLSLVSPDKPLQAVVFTSAGPGEGKSLTSANLSIACAQMGKRVLLIDTDLRRPMLHHLFGLKREPGFSDLFSANADYNSIIHASVRPNLSILTAGMFTPNPSELLGSQKMTVIMDYFRKNYDRILFDTPPVLAVTDATLLGTRVDGVLIVVKAHHTDREIEQRAVSSLENVGIKVLGVSLNDINLSHRYGSYGYYKYYYHYHKSKSD